MKKVILITKCVVVLVIIQTLLFLFLLYKGNKPAIPSVKAAEYNLSRSTIGMSEKTIGRAKLVFNPYEGYSNKFKNLEIALSKIDGVELAPGETFSFNQFAGLHDKNVDEVYKPGYNVMNRLVSAGGVCSAAVLIASAANNASLQFKDLDGNDADGPVPHRNWMDVYHRTHEVDGIKVTSIDATVATEVDPDGKSYSLNDVAFTNNSSKRIVIRVNWEWNESVSNMPGPLMGNQVTAVMVARINTFN